MPDRHPYPILYSFRRCPYAIRARLAIAYSGVSVRLREVMLKDKPRELLVASPKGTVPVLQLGDGRVLEQSLDIMHWALAEADPDDWLLEREYADMRPIAERLVRATDSDFKPALDHYKYADRHPETSAEQHRNQCEPFLARLNTLLSRHPHLMGQHASFADAAIFPFVRQCAFVDKTWFAQCPWPHLQQWLQRWLDSSLFQRVMAKYPPWRSTGVQTLFPETP